jgi:hypothetical protein
MAMTPSSTARASSLPTQTWPTYTLLGSRMNVRLHKVRLEAFAGSSDRPIIVINNSSHGNIVDRVLGQAHVWGDADRNPGIDLTSHKLVGKVGVCVHDWPV